MSIKVLLADDHPVVRDGLKYVIEKEGGGIKVVAEASNGKEVLALAERKAVDVFVVDISMPILNGIETTAELVKKNPANKVIILSIHGTQSFVEKALDAGAKGYLLKESATEDIIFAIKEVSIGRYFLCPAISKFVVNGFLGKRPDYQRHTKIVELTSREREILQLIAEGFTSKEIHKHLNVSMNTVLVHRKNIMQKLNIHKQADLVRYAIKEGISKL